MKFRHQSIALALLLTAFASVGVLAQSNRLDTRGHPPQPRPPREEKLVTLKFNGGTATDYANALKKSAGDVNIVIALEAAEVPMPAVELTNASLESALNVLDGRSIIQSDRMVELRVLDDFRGHEGEQPVYTVEANVQSRSIVATQSSKVWSVADALEDGAKSADILTAIQASLDLLGDTYKPAKLKFHESTGLVIARGAPEQMDAISQVVNQIVGNRSNAAIDACVKDRDRLAEKVANLEKALAEAKQR